MNINPIIKLDRVLAIPNSNNGTDPAIRFSVIWYNEEWGRPMYKHDGWRLLKGWVVVPPTTFGKSGTPMKLSSELDNEFSDAIKRVLETYPLVYKTMGPWQNLSPLQLDEEEKSIL